MTADPSIPEDTAPRSPRAVWILIAATALIRLWIAQHLELTGAEAEGWISARFPAPSYFDHPPLWGWLTWLATGGARLAIPIAVRLPAVLFGAASTFVLYRWVSELRSPAVGWVAALLYNTSFLFSAIGIVSLPDSPLCFFWLLTTYCVWKGVHPSETTARERRWILLSGLPLGLALLSSYTAFLLILGVFGYLVADRTRRAWLSRPEPWIAVGLAFM